MSVEKRVRAATCPGVPWTVSERAKYESEPRAPASGGFGFGANRRITTAPLRWRLGFLAGHSSLVTRHCFTGTRRFSSSNQFSTTLICVGAGCSSLALIIRKRWPSGETS